MEMISSFSDWSQIQGPCSLENFTSVILVVFLVFLSVRFLLIKLKIGGSGDGGGDENDAKNVSLGYSYTASIWISSFLLSSRLLGLFLVFILRCNFTFNIFSDEVLQILSWSLTLSMLYSLRNKSEKLPWILRSWWILSFLNCIIHVALDTHSIISSHRRRSPTVEEYINYSNLIPCVYMLWFSIRGTTGITFIGSASISDPLLPKPTDVPQLSLESGSPYGRASLLQLITFSWLNPLLSVGIKKPLNLNQVPELDTGDSAEFLSRSFGEIMSRTRQERRFGNSLVYRSIFIFIRKKAGINAIFAAVNAGASYVGPSLINNLVSFLNGTSEKKNRLRSGYALVGMFLAAKVVETICQRQWVFGARQLMMRLRAALTSHTYRKGLHLSSRSRQSHTSGEIINYMSVDILRITDFMWHLNIILMLPIQISLAILVLHLNLGLGSIATLAAAFMVMACNFPLIKLQKKFQSKIMEAKDDRMKATSEVLKNMKTLKLQAWDMEYLKRLVSLRGIEHTWLWKSLRLSAFSAFIFWGSPTFISVATFGCCILMGIPLTVGSVLSALATFSMLQDPIFNLPDVLSAFAQAKVSVDRLATYLDEPEIPTDAVEFVPRQETDFDIEIVNGEFSWEEEEEKEYNSDDQSSTLSGIQLSIKRGTKVAICGTVGAGKSSLLASVLGEIPKLKGKVKVSGSKAYVPQSAWILTGNVRDNILFGLPYDAEKYEETIHACALTKDLSLLGNGDLTEIGERGINMSGGQKQRIQIARAIYQNADIYLLDDPFSAVDAHTGTQLFQECLMRILKDKTIVYVTHQIEFLPAADLILVMQNGRIAQVGRFEELLRQNIGFEVLVGAHSEALRSVTTVENSSRIISPEEEKENSTTEDESHFEIGEKQDSDLSIDLSMMDKGRLTQEEEREKGSIGKAVYLAYLKAVKGGILIPFILVAQSFFQVLQVLSNYWIAWASPPTIDMPPRIEMNILFLVYIILATGSAVCVLVRSMLVAITGLLTAEKLFKDMLYSVLHAPMSFFDSTPTGRILNRVSTDQSVLDLDMAGRLGWCAFSVIRILGTIIVMSQVSWPVFIVFIPVTMICIWYERYYIPTARELARLSGIQRTPILHHFSESLSGTATIRAFRHEQRFATTNLSLIDNYSRPWFHNISAMEWLSFRLNVLSNFVFAFSLILLVTLPKGFINPSIAGLAVTYGLSLNSQLGSIIWNVCNAENKMISVERILQYTRIKSEAPLVVEECRPPENWPENGTICFKNLQVRYAEHLPSVLKNITCVFPGKKKIGVVGRTGSGKSTLIQALFRIIEPREGTIEIENIDICKIGLHDLRSRLSIIPQDPTMFEGTVRGNLDPLGEYSDLKIWEVLDKCQIGDLVRAKEKKLDSKVAENGDNWSVGQRQLFCLGRSLLKRSSILVLDEATASIDSATDSILQRIIRQEFKDCTVLTIAHRIHTVIDSDLVLVLSDGRIVEYDSPARLLEREDSFFSKLIREYSLRSQNLSNLTNSES